MFWETWNCLALNDRSQILVEIRHHPQGPDGHTLPVQALGFAQYRSQTVCVSPWYCCVALSCLQSEVVSDDGDDTESDRGSLGIKLKGVWSTVSTCDAQTLTMSLPNSCKTEVRVP